MANGAKAYLAGRFSPGTDVDLVRVAGAHVLRAEGGEAVGSATVGDDGVVEFTDGVVEGGYYFIVGYIDGFPREVRIRGTADDATSVNRQAPVQPERVKLSDGTFLDEPPKPRDVPGPHVGPGVAQEQVPEGTPQRVSVGRGQGFPVDPDESTPEPRQEDEDGPQMVQADTGTAFPIVPSVDRQEDAEGIQQRVVADTGQAFPIPAGDAVDAAKMRDSSLAKVARGGPQGAMTSPLEAADAPKVEADDEPEKPKAKSRARSHRTKKS